MIIIQVKWIKGKKGKHVKMDEHLEITITNTMAAECQEKVKVFTVQRGDSFTINCEDSLEKFITKVVNETLTEGLKKRGHV